MGSYANVPKATFYPLKGLGVGFGFLGIGVESLGVLTLDLLARVSGLVLFKGSSCSYLGMMLIDYPCNLRHAGHHEL